MSLVKYNLFVPILNLICLITQKLNFEKKAFGSSGFGYFPQVVFNFSADSPSVGQTTDSQPLKPLEDEGHHDLKLVCFL